MSEKQKEAQTILAKIRKVVFGEEDTAQKFTEAALEDGTPINIAGEGIAEGAAVTLADGTPLADGEYKLADGSGITVAGGSITAVAAKQTPPPTPEEQMTAEQMKTLMSKFAAGTPEERVGNIETLVRALMQYNFGYELNQGYKDQAIAIYKQGFAAETSKLQDQIKELQADKAKQAQAFATQKEANKQVIDLLEILVKEPVAAPATQSKSPFAAQKPDKDAAFKTLSDILQTLKKTQA